MAKKILYLRSKVPGLTVTPVGMPSIMLNPGETHEASKFDPDFIASIEEARYPDDADKLELVELDPREAAYSSDPSSVVEEPESEDDDDEEEDDDLYDPSDYTVAEVLEYLKTADSDEVERVKVAEAESSRASVQVADYEAE